jgi:predicted alpha/beta superfamily hydrolase
MKNTAWLIITFVAAFSFISKGISSNDTIPQHDSLVIASEYVQEDRLINIWLPKAYQNSTDRFPVLYMPDGGMKEDFPHIANTLQKLIEAGKIPPFILVGIENTVRGRDLTGVSEVEEDKQYCPLSDGAKDFRAFITSELMPEINGQYRTTGIKGIIGESLAGLFVMETFFLAPNTFDFYIAMDPSLWWNNYYLEKNAAKFLRKFPQANKKLWFAGSATKGIAEATQSVEQTLMKTSPDNLVWKYSDEPKEEHHTIFRATKEKAMIWSLNGINSGHQK